jgi:hemolysin activation/secretion protein
MIKKIFRYLELLWVALVLWCLMAQAGYAQENPTAEIRIAETSTQTNLTQNANAAQDDGNEPQIETDKNQPSAEVNLFDILEFNVTGNTLLKNTVIEQAVYPFLGEKRSIDDAEKARTALEKNYHDAGYLTVLVNIPEQKVDGGVVQLEVVESKVDQLRVTGSRYYSLGNIKQGVPELAEGKTPHFPTLQKQIEALNRLPDRAVTPVMKAGKTPGTVSMELKVKDTLPLHATLGLNNNYSVDTKELRAVANIHYDNLWQLGHSINLTFMTNPQKVSESKVFSATYAVPLESGANVAVYAVHTDSDVAAINTLGVIGNGDILGLRYIKPLPIPDEAKSFFHTFTGGVDYKNFGQSVNLLGGDAVRSPIEYMPFVFNYDAGYRGAESITLLGLSLNTQVRGLVAEEQVFRDKRYLAHSNYAYLRGNVAYKWNMPSGIRLDLKMSGQLTDQPLISNEQFSVGGADSVRGYLQSEVLGDVGYLGNVEVHSPKFGQFISSKIQDLHVLGFVDFGTAITLEPLSGQKETYNLAGAGAGLRFRTMGINGVIDLAVPLNNGAIRRVSGGEAFVTRAGDAHIHFNLEYAF